MAVMNSISCLRQNWNLNLNLSWNQTKCVIFAQKFYLTATADFHVIMIIIKLLWINAVTVRLRSWSLGTAPSIEQKWISFHQARNPRKLAKYFPGWWPFWGEIYLNDWITVLDQAEQFEAPHKATVYINFHLIMNQLVMELFNHVRQRETAPSLFLASARCG